MSILVTGGCGFIGSNLVRHLLSKGVFVVNVDCMSYNSRTPDVTDESNYIFIQKNLRDADLLKILVDHNIQYVYHLAAQTHVDLSFRNSVHFSQDNGQIKVALSFVAPDSASRQRNADEYEQINIK